MHKAHGYNITSPISPAIPIMTLLTRVLVETGGKKKTSPTIVIRAEGWCINSVLVSEVTSMSTSKRKKGYKNDSRNNTTRVCEHHAPSSSSPPMKLLSAPINTFIEKTDPIKTSNLGLLPSPRGLSQQQRKAIRPAQKRSNVDHKRGCPTHIWSPASSKRSSRSAHRASCTKQR